MTATSHPKYVLYMEEKEMALAKVIYLGEDNEKLRNGMTYTVLSVSSMHQKVGGARQYTFEEVDGFYDSVLFKLTTNRRTPYIAILKAPTPPIVGECMENLMRLNDREEWENVRITDPVEKIWLMSCTGNVYAVHTRHETYTLSYFKTAE